MFNAGQAREAVVFQTPTEVLDSLGAPSRTWSTIRECFAQIENEQVTASENIKTPYESNSRSFTLIVRVGGPQITTRERVIAADDSWKGAIVGMRYSALRDVMFIDVVTGASAG